MVSLTIDNKKVSVPEGTTIMDAAKSVHIEIPHLCYLKGINEIAACRICVVEVEGNERLVTSCNNLAEEGMVIYTNSKKVRTSRRTTIQLLLSQHDSNCPSCVRSGNCSLQSVANDLNIYEEIYPKDVKYAKWNHNLPLIRNESKCIKCMRCVQICEKVQSVNIWDVSGTGSRTTVDVSLNRALDATECTYCGQCITHCPVGALRERDDTTRVMRAICDPEITTVVRNINPTDTALFLGSESHILHGEGYITDRLCGLEFRISPRSFYQVNPIQTEVLYGKAKEFAGLTGTETVIDAYCGTGTIGLTVASGANGFGGAKAVIGVEVNKDAVADAVENAGRNGVTNAVFHAADAGEFMEAMAVGGQTADVVITDPPRAGCSGKFLHSLMKLAPKRIVYVSCNPETLARDLYTLTKGGYRVKKIQPVDMFPFTSHAEVVVSLERKQA